MQILKDVVSGVLPGWVGTFAELHDYTDANEYGGFCDGHPIMDEPVHVWVDFVNDVQTALDAWLRAGHPL